MAPASGAERSHVVDDRLVGERLSVAERMIPAPWSGTFEPGPVSTFTAEGEVLYEGQSVGTVFHSGVAHPVQSPFTGFLMAVLATSGERVRSGQPLLWLRSCDPGDP